MLALLKVVAIGITLQGITTGMALIFGRHRYRCFAINEITIPNSGQVSTSPKKATIRMQINSFLLSFNGREGPIFQLSFQHVSDTAGLSEGYEGGYEYKKRIWAVHGRCYGDARMTKLISTQRLLTSSQRLSQEASVQGGRGLVVEDFPRHTHLFRRSSVRSQTSFIPFAT